MRLTINSVNGVSFNQTIHGHIIANVSAQNAAAFKDELKRAIAADDAWLLAEAEMKKLAIQEKMRMPISPVAAIDAEIAALKAGAEFDVEAAVSTTTVTEGIIGDDGDF